MQSTNATPSDLQTTQAAAARNGIRLQRIEYANGNSVFVVSRWNLSIAIGTLEQAQGLIKRMTGGAK